MMDRRVRGAFAAAIAFAAVALLPGSAGAHCATNTSLTAGPNAERYTDWTGGNDGCLSGAAVRMASAEPAPAKPAPPADARAGTLRQVGHNPLMNRGMNAAIA